MKKCRVLAVMLIFLPGTLRADNVNDALAADLLEKCQRAAERLDAFSFDLESIFESDGGTKLVWTYHIERRSDDYRIEYSGDVNVGAEKGRTRRMKETGILIGNQAHTIVAETLADIGPMMPEVYEHAPQDDKSSREKMRRNVIIPDALAKCAVWKPSIIQYWLEHVPSDSRWSAEKIDKGNGQFQYRVQLSKFGPSPELRRELIIDPQKGHLATEYRIYVRGDLLQETVVRFEPSREGGGAPCPAELTERRWERSATTAVSQPALQSEATLKWKISNFVVERPPAERFTLGSVRDFGEHDHVMLFRADGRQADARVVDGELVDIVDSDPKK